MWILGCIVWLLAGAIWAKSLANKIGGFWSPSQALANVFLWPISLYYYKKGE